MQWLSSSYGAAWTSALSSWVAFPCFLVPLVQAGHMLGFLSGQVWIIAWGSKPSIYLEGGKKVFVKQIFVWSASVTAMMDKVRTVLKAFAHVNIILKLSVSMEEIYLLQHPPGASLGRWGDALEPGVMALPWLWVPPSLMSLGDLLNQQWVSRYLHSQGQVRCQGLQLLEIPLSVFYLGFNLLISHRCSGGKCQGKWRLEEQHSSGRNNFSHQIFFLGRSKK